jgi:hypothetical protein
MHPERALRVIKLLDIPEHKRKFWPQQAAVIVRDCDREIVDVIQFDANAFTESEKYSRLYPGSTTFFAFPDTFQSVADLEARIASCYEPVTDSTYVVGHGLLGKLKHEREPDA